VKPALTEAICVRCGAAHDIGGVLYICEQCGGNLDLLYDYEALSKRSDEDALALLAPVALDPELLTELRSWGRLRPASRLATDLGLSNLRLLDETCLPSGSLKDRASLITLLRARELGMDTVAAASTGNAGASLACLAARLGLKAVIFAPRSAPPAKLRQIRAHGATLHLVDGNYDRAFELCLEAVAERGWYSRNTGHNPWCGEGKKTAAIALVEQAGGRSPDFIFVPVGDGCILGGVHKGLVDLQRIGRLETMPRLVAVQAEGSAAIANAWNSGDTINAVKANTLADSIAVDLPRDADKALRALRDTRGFAITVSDGEILEAIGDLARREGIFAEPAGAAALAGLRKAMASGQVDPASSAIALVTGHGLKDPGALDPLIEESPVVDGLKDLP
jgi:threonine synthase